jgi:HK97 family phage prohead protease
MTTIVHADTETGWFEGYASSFGGDPDLGGDVVERGAFRRITELVNAGLVNVPIVAARTGGGHGDLYHADPRDVIGSVVSAEEDDRGWRIRARLSADPDAQLLRQKLLAGGLSMSIGYLVADGGSRPLRLPDGRMGRILSDVDVFHVALTPVPMNPRAVVVAAKAGAATWPPAGSAGVADVVTPMTAALADARRRDPAREELARKAAWLEAHGWPPAHLVEQLGVEAAYDMAMRPIAARLEREAARHDPAAEAKAAWNRRQDEAMARKAADDERTRRAAAGQGCGACHRCVGLRPDLCAYLP